MDILFELTAYHWLALGLILFGAEALGAAGFLLGAGAAALATGLVVWFAPELAPGGQLALFAIASVMATYLYFQVFRQVQDDADTPLINQRAASLIGHEFALTEDIHHGAGRVQIGDTLWRVQCEGELAAGTEVRISGASDMSLRLTAKERH
jgi:membrane protein implicated in regulation of membrane protease activity